MKIETYRSMLDNSYKNVIDYRTLTNSSDIALNKLDKETLFNIFNAKYGTYENVNFDYGNLLNTSITINITSDSGTLMLCNYLKATPEEGEPDFLGQQYPLYYFINNVEQLNKYTYRFDLELDVMTTYFERLEFYSKVTFNRRHCERFGYASEDDVYFTYNRDCLLDNTRIESNILNGPSNIQYSYDFSSSYTTEQQTLIKTLYECKWLYIFLSNNIPLETENDVGKWFYQWKNGELKQYPYIPLKSTYVPLKTSAISSIKSSLPFMTLIFPVYTSISASGMSSSVLTRGIEDILGNSDLTSYILSAKLSNRCPFTQSQIKNNFQSTKNDRGFYLLNDDSRGVFKNVDCYPILLRGSRDYTMGFFYQYQDTYHKITINPYNRSFKTLPTINDKRNIDLEPQFYTSKYSKQGIKPYNKELMDLEPYLMYSTPKVKTLKVNLYEYDYTFLNYDVTTLIYPYQNCDMIQEGKSYINNSDWCVVNDNYSNAMASQKNSLYMGLLTNVASGYTNAILGSQLSNNGVSESVQKYNNNFGYSSLKTTISSPNTSGKTKILGNLIGASVNSIMAIQNYNAQMQDLKNTPNSIKIQGMDILNELNYFSKGFGNYISYTLDNTQKEVVYNYYYDYGYQVNKSYSLSSKVEYGTNIITRKLFNYIKIQDDEFTYKSYRLSKLPSIIKDKIEEVFNNGFKLWEYIDCEESFIKSYLFSNENENVEIYDIKEIEL